MGSKRANTRDKAQMVATLEINMEEKKRKYPVPYEKSRDELFDYLKKHPGARNKAVMRDLNWTHDRLTGVIKHFRSEIHSGLVLKSMINQ